MQRQDSTLWFRKPTPNATTYSAKIKDADDEEVKEYLPIFEDGDDNACLSAIFKKLLALGSTYDYWQDGKSKKLGQMLSRALGRVDLISLFGCHSYQNVREGESSERPFELDLKNRILYVGISIS